MHCTRVYIIILHICAVHDGVEVANRPKYRGLLHATSAIVREDGMRGLFRVLFKMIIKMSCT